MFNVKKKKFKLSELFSNKRGNSKLTKSYCNKNKGIYEVFTGTTKGSFGFINSYEYSEDLLTYTTDGEYAGTVQVLTGKFNVGGHRAILIPIVENVNLNYFAYVLTSIINKKRKNGSVPSITWRDLKNESIFLPVLENGNLDYDFQTEVANKYIKLNQLKSDILLRLKELQETNVSLEIGDSVNKSVSEIANVKRGNSKLTKSFGRMNAGDNPVYSADNSKPLCYTNSYEYDGKYLTVSINGIAGVTKVIDGRFSLNADRAIFIIKEEYDTLEIDFLKLVIEPFLRNIAKGRKGENNKNEFTKLTPKMIENITIPIPVVNGEIDIQRQKEIVRRQKYIESLKNEILNKAQKILSYDLVGVEEPPYF